MVPTQILCVRTFVRISQQRHGIGVQRLAIGRYRYRLEITSVIVGPQALDTTSTEGLDLLQRFWPDGA